MNGNGLQLMEIYMGIGGLEFGSGVTRSPGLVLDPLKDTRIGLLMPRWVDLWLVR